YQAEWNTTGLTDGEHVLTATARDASGQEARHTVSVETENSGGACDNLPTAVITEPEDGSYVYGDITVRVNASDDIGVIRVRVFVDAGMIWEDVTTPFEGVWHTADFTEGPHLIRAEATDTADQQSAETSLEVDVDRTPPTITITAPSDGETVSGTRVVTANATDNLSVASVVFTATGGLTRSFTDTEAPFEWSLDFPGTTECDTNVAIEAETIDRAGWTATDTVTVILEPMEVCNDLDDDCDGETDEDFDCRTGTTGTCTTSCGSAGTRPCSSTCTWGTCTLPVEICNGRDDDCNGLVDDGFIGEPCDGPDGDLCLEGSLVCSAGSWTCSDTTTTNSETCNGLDDDCDTLTDEDCP
ncbi:MAG: Ig-like domain-containing protein, partial [Syntrophales bacterium]